MRRVLRQGQQPLPLTRVGARYYLIGMEHLALEVFDLGGGTGSQYAALPADASITITVTSEIFASGDVWSHSFTLNVMANANLFGTAGDIHGARLHEQINKRKARLWVDGLPLYLGYLKLDDEAEVDADGNVEVRFESGQKTFDEMIEGTSAREVSVGDVVIGVALNRKRVVSFDDSAVFLLNGLSAYAKKDDRLKGVDEHMFSVMHISNSNSTVTPYTQRWPKLVKSHGKVLDSSGNSISPVPDYTNVQAPYDAKHPFCNINICYPFKAMDEKGEEVAGRGYTIRLAHGKPTVDGGDDQTRYNNAPNFYLLYFVDRLFKDLNIHIAENQAKDVDDLCRVFMLNYGCHYEEIENDNNYFHSDEHTTPEDQDDKHYLSRYGQYYLPLIDATDVKGNILEQCLVSGWDNAGKAICVDENVRGKVLIRDLKIEKGGVELLTLGSVEGQALGTAEGWFGDNKILPFSTSLVRSSLESDKGAYSAYLAYATGDNYPNVDISEIINAMKSMFGVRLIFGHDYKTVRIVLLRNIFRNSDVQEIICDIVAPDEKVENSIRGFRMTYGKGTDNTSFYYKGFADLFQRAATTWKDTSDKHDYSQWEVNAIYDEIKQYMSSFNRTCYVTPANGNAYGTQVDEDEDVLFPSLFEWAGYMDAEDGDCSMPESDGKTVEEVQCGATPVLMNEVGIVYASLFGGDLKAPTPDMPADADYEFKYTEHPALGQKFATFGRSTMTSITDYSYISSEFNISGKLDLFISEGFKIRMKDSYAISNGGTPFDEADPGLCFGVMRGSGDDAYVRYYYDADDQEGNRAWDIEPGTGAISHPDSCDNYGNLWDYNGDSSGVGPTEGRVSLKLRAEKLNPFFNPKLAETHYDPEHPELNTNPRYLHIDNQNLQGRGLCDQFYKEYSYWVRNARIVKRTVRMELAQLLAIDKTKRVHVGDVTGFIRKIQYSVNNKTGIGNVTMEIMYI